LKTESVDISKIIPYSRNPRNNDESVDNVASSIKEFGFRQPIVVDEDFVVLAGHTRLKASKKLNLKEVPVHMATGLSDGQKKAFRLMDNRSAEDSKWDDKLLSLELVDLKELGLDLDITGFTEKEIVTALNVEESYVGLTDEDETPEIPEEAETEIGQIWKLGNHRVLCGDNTDSQSLEKLLDDKTADLYLTDPPYNVNYEGSNALKIKNDNLKDEDFNTFLTESFLNARQKLKSGSSFYIFHADSEGYNFRSACRNSELDVRQCLIWVKNALVMGRQDYHWQHEPILYGWMKGSSNSWYSDRKQTTILNFPKPMKNKEHPTMKPVAMVEYLIKNSSKHEDIVLDTFLGSGSIIIACEKSNRICYGIELEPKYCDVIIKRWEDFTGEKAQLIKK